MASAKKYPAISAHGDLEKITDVVYMVSGSYKMAPGLRISNNMVIVKRGDDLTVINSIRVSDAVEDEIKKLGTVKNVVRLCSNHGASDEYWIDTYKATYYDIPGGATAEGATKVPETTNYLEDGKEFAGIKDSKVFLVKNLKMPDAILYLPDDGGMLIAGDFIQNGCPTPQVSFMAKNFVNPLLGFNTGCLCTPPMFLKLYGKGEDVYVNVPALMELEFDTIISSHGPIVKSGAKDKLKDGWTKVKKGDIWKAP